jgi:hypothetical protein
MKTYLGAIQAWDLENFPTIEDCAMIDTEFQIERETLNENPDSRDVSSLSYDWEW